MSQLSVLTAIKINQLPPPLPTPFLGTIDPYRIKYIYPVDQKAEDGTLVPCFRVYYGVTAHLQLDEYDFPTNGLTVAQFKTLVETETGVTNLVQFDDVLSIDTIEQPDQTKDLLVNDAVYRTYYNNQNNTTNVYVDLGSGKSVKEKWFVVNDNQTGFPEFYYYYEG